MALFSASWKKSVSEDVGDGEGKVMGEGGGAGGVNGDGGGEVGGACWVTVQAYSNIVPAIAALLIAITSFIGDVDGRVERVTRLRDRATFPLN